AGVLAVVDVDHRQPVQADDAVKFRHDAVEVVDDVVAGIVDMARVKAHGQALVLGDAVDDGRQFLEGATYLGALAGHGLQGDANIVVLRQHLVQSFDDAPDAVVQVLVGVGAGVQHQVLHAHVGGAPDLLLEEGDGQLKHFLLIGAQVDDVGGVDDEDRKSTRLNSSHV